MFKDAQRELQRLEEELLAEEEEELEESAGEAEDEDFMDFSEFDQDMMDRTASTLVFRSGAEKFRQQLNEQQRKAVPVRAYNSDETDQDLDDYSEEVWEPRKKGESLGGLVVLAIILTLGIVAVVAWWMVRFMGLTL